MKSLLLFAISFLCFSPFCLAQTVWPGDVNNNGIVNEIDLLYLGFAFNAIGPTRVDASTNWTPQEITEEWDGTFPDGLNFVYADCNGDGIINELDADVIEDNIDSLQNELLIPDEILISASDLDPKFAFDSTSFNAVQGVPKEINLNFGSDIQRIPNVQGFSFTISGDTRFFKAEDIKFRFVPLSWLELTGRPNISKFFPNTEEGKLTISFIKTDNQAEMGGGQIGAVSFVLIEDIVDFRPTEDTIKLEIDSITVVTDELEKIVVAGASTIINVPSLTTSINTYNPILDKIKFYPNPTNGWLLLKSEDIFIERVELVNTLGQVVYHKQLSNTTFQSLDLQHIPEGMYWLRMITEVGTKSTSIQRL